MGDLLLLAIYITIGVGGYKLYKYIQLRKSQINLIRFDQEMSDLQQQREKMMTLHQMLTDIEICDAKEDQWKVFNISWKNEVTGEVRAYDLYVYDKKSSVASALKNLVEVEMNDMTPQLKEDIERLKLRSKMMSSKQRKIVEDVENSNHFMI